MTPVFQTIISQTKGNCMQAAYASILDLPLEAVPNFTELPDSQEHGNAHSRADDFLKTLGLCRFRIGFYRNEVLPHFMHAMEFSTATHFLLSVPSQKFKDCSHVVVGRMGIEEYGLEVAHDPNPKNKPYDLRLTPPTAATLLIRDL